MYFYQFLPFLFIFLISCDNGVITPKKVASKTSECIDLRSDLSILGIENLNNCMDQRKEMMLSFKDDSLWLVDYNNYLKKFVKINPKSAALLTCDCLKIGMIRESSNEIVKALSYCSSLNREIIAPYRTDPAWQNEFNNEIKNGMSDCTNPESI